MAISIHALREEGDSSDKISPAESGIFLSTPSARRATEHKHLDDLFRAISIHALREEGDVSGVLYLVAMHLISIHALREEGDWS